MTFDPFGDFETRGYLRNLANEKDLDIVRRLEHTSFATGIDAAFDRLATVKRISYQDVLETHEILFEAVYPWAGQDRLVTAPDLAVSKGSVLFARPEDIQRAVDFALDHGQDKKFMIAKPGQIMGYLAYGHPFLDGNGRTIMVVHGVLAQLIGRQPKSPTIFLRSQKNWTVPARAISTPTSSTLFATQRPLTAWRPQSLRRPASMEAPNSMKCSERRMILRCKRGTSNRNLDGVGLRRHT